MIKVGCPESLAARLYIDNLGDRLPPYTVEHDTPAAVSRMLAAGELDVALIPAIDYYSLEDYVLIPDAAVTCQGESNSAWLVLRRPLAEAGRVGIDPDCTAESTLAQVLLSQEHGLEPEYVVGDAAGLAGDESLDCYVSCCELAPEGAFGGLEVIDLAEAWWRFARLPFVFSVWAARREAQLAGFEKALALAKREGLRRPVDSVQAEAERRRMPPRIIHDYLTRTLGFNLSTVELGGMETFHRYAVKCGIAEDGGSIEFYR